MRKFLYGLGAVIDFETKCEEIADFIDMFYYTSIVPPTEETKIINCCVEKYGKDYLVYMESNATPVSHEKIKSYISYSIIQRLTEQEKENSIYLHSSAFIHKQRLFVLFNSSGAGKTTLTAYCLKNNLEDINYLSDDILRIDFKQNIAYGLACGQRIKSGSKELYFKDEPLNNFLEDKQKIWIYKPNNKIDLKYNIEDYEQIILLNVNYNQKHRLQVKKLNNMEKMQALISNLYNIKSNSRMITRNLLNISKCNMYSAEFYDTKEIMQWIMTGIGVD